MAKLLRWQTALLPVKQEALVLSDEDKKWITTLVGLVRWTDIQKTEHCRLLIEGIEKTNERFRHLPVKRVFISPVVPTEHTGEIMLRVSKSEVALMRGRFKEDPINQIFRAIDYRDPTEEDFDFLEMVYPDLLAGAKYWCDLFRMWERGETFSAYC